MHRHDAGLLGRGLRGLHQPVEPDLHRHQCAPVLLGQRLDDRHLQWLDTVLSERELRSVHQLVSAELCQPEHGASLRRHELGPDDLHGAQPELLRRGLPTVQRRHPA